MAQDNMKHDGPNPTEPNSELEGDEGLAKVFEEASQDLSDQLSSKDEEIRSLQDRLLRLAAEMENVRKRLEREKSEGICFANESLMRDLLPVIDNLERAVEHGANDANAEALLGGVQMTLRAFTDVLTRYGCKSFESVGKPFDPNFHEAMMQEESQDLPENTVIREFQKGYTLNDRLLRPAMVIVSKNPG